MPKETSKNKAGRAPKLSPLIASSLCGFVEQGVPFKDCAILCGIGERTLHQWRAKGQADIEAGKPTTRYAQFKQRLDVSESTCVQRSCLVVMASAKEDWRAAAWLLERRRPEQFGRNDRFNVGVQAAVPTAADPATATPVQIVFQMTGTSEYGFTDPTGNPV